MNPILGKQPNNNDLDLYFLGSLTTQILITDYLDKQLRMPFILSLIGFEIMIIKHNKTNGFTISFNF